MFLSYYTNNENRSKMSLHLTLHTSISVNGSIIYDLSLRHSLNIRKFRSIDRTRSSMTELSRLVCVDKGRGVGNCSTTNEL